MAITRDNCICEYDQSNACGFDHINHEIPHDCTYKPVVHTTTKDKYCKVVTREFPLQRTGRLLSSAQDRLTLVVKYQYSNNTNTVLSVHLKTHDDVSNSTQWHELSTDDLKTFINVFTAVKNDIIHDEEVFLF